MQQAVVLYLLCVSSYFGLSCCSHRVPNIDVRIAGGILADIKDFPYQLSLQWLENGKVIYQCGAAILSTSWAVTAAHCVYRRTVQQVRLHSGSNFRYTGGQLHDIQQIRMHPNYNDDTLDYDLAVLKVSKSFQFSEVVKPIKLPHQTPSVGTVAVLAGWGRMSETVASPDQLMKVTVGVIRNQDCSRVFKKNSKIIFTNRMFCVGVSNNNRGPCRGDSGSPLVANGELIGVLSWFANCGTLPTGYTDVFLLRQWITSITGVN